MKIVSVVGARPQFIKAWPTSKALREAGHQEYLIHTGQHYDYLMSKVFFDELDIPVPDVNLEVGSDRHGRQTGRMLEKIEDILLSQNPDWVLVYGDTNSTLAAALAAVKLHLRLAHAEAGLRSFNREMPEEHNRVLTDHCSDLLFCPTPTAVENLRREGIERGVYMTGDVMLDALLKAKAIAIERSKILNELELKEKAYYLATVHRAENTDNSDNLSNIIKAFTELSREYPVVFPLHPRTRKALEVIGVNVGSSSSHNAPRFIPPVGYLDMLRLEESAKAILTDSGGVQKEAFWLQTPCITLRNDTEWIETVDSGWNQLVGSSAGDIVSAIEKRYIVKSHRRIECSNSAQAIVHLLSHI